MSVADRAEPGLDAVLQKSNISDQRQHIESDFQALMWGIDQLQQQHQTLQPSLTRLQPSFDLQNTSQAGGDQPEGQDRQLDQQQDLQQLELQQHKIQQQQQQQQQALHLSAEQHGWRQKTWQQQPLAEIFEVEARPGAQLQHHQHPWLVCGAEGAAASTGPQTRQPVTPVEQKLHDQQQQQQAGEVLPLAICVQLSCNLFLILDRHMGFINC
jgi:hypothetical protein